MAKIPSKISERITNGIKTFQPILESARSRDVGESDTSTIIRDMLSEVFGYGKYTDVTTEYAIRGTYCDLAIKLDNVLQSLIEAKAIGLELKDAHVKQAVDYAANQGVDWVVLTNGIIWRVYKVIFGKPIDQELVIELDFLSLSPKSAKDIESIYLLCKEGWIKSVLGEYHSQKQALSRFYLGAMILSDTVVQTIRRELRRVSPDLRVEIDEIREVLTTEVLKREVLEGDKAIEAKRRINRANNKQQRMKTSRKSLSDPTAGASIDSVEQAESDESPLPEDSERNDLARDE
jgi:hypothetical protein